MPGRFELFRFSTGAKPVTRIKSIYETDLFYTELDENELGIIDTDIGCSSPSTFS